MNTVKACVLAGFAIMVLGGCIRTRTLSVSQENRSALGYAQGRPWLQSVKRNTVDVCLLTPTYKTYLFDLLPPAFYVVVRNGGDKAISFSRNDITATVEGRPIDLLTYEEYRDEIIRQEGPRSVKVLKALGGLEPTYGEAVPFPQERPVVDRNGYTWYASSYWDANHSGYAGRGVTDDKGQLLIDEQTITVWGDTLLADARLMLMRDHYSIAPGQAGAGVVRLEPSDLSSGQRLRILVRTGDETHEFLYDVRS